MSSTGNTELYVNSKPDPKIVHTKYVVVHWWEKMIWGALRDLLLFVKF